MLLNRRRWIVYLLLALTLLVFVGFSLFPLLEGVTRQDRPLAGATSVTPQSSSLAQQAELELQAKGYELVLQREPDNQTALRGLFETRLQLRDLQGSLAPLERLAALNPQESDYMVLIAQAKQKLGDREGAAQAYRTVLEAQPGDMNALQGLVSLLLQEKRPEAAIALLQDKLKTATQLNQAQQESIDTTSIQLMLAQVYFNQQRYPEAIAIYDTAIENDKEDFRPTLGKALVLKHLGQIEQAQPLFKTATSLAPPQYKDQIKQIAAAAQVKPTGTVSPSPAPSISPTPSTTP